MTGDVEKGGGCEERGSWRKLENTFCTSMLMPSLSPPFSLEEVAASASVVAETADTLDLRGGMVGESPAMLRVVMNGESSVLEG